MKRLKRYLEPPKQRRERKEREYTLSVLRTVFGAIGATCAVASLLVSALIFWKVWN